MREYLGELFAEKCPQYFELPERERPYFIMVTLPAMLRTFVASVLFEHVITPEDLPFSLDPLPLPKDSDREDKAMFTFLEGVLDSWTASLNAHQLYADFGASFQALVDPMTANYKYGVFMNTPTLEHADWLASHTPTLAHVRSGAAPRYGSNLVWEAYINRFGKDQKRPAREPNSRLIEEHLDAIEAQAHLTEPAPGI
jgi:hypothetical protein